MDSPVDQPRVVRFRNRETGALESERIFGENALRFLYEDRVGRFLTDRLLSLRATNHVYGWFQRSRLSRGNIPGFIAKLGIDADEAEQPLTSYRSLDDFFTRRLRPGARPIDTMPDHFVAPADGRTLAFPTLTEQRLPIKGAEVGLAELCGGEDRAARYVGGAALVVRLAPADYHRFHFPAAGTASPVASIGTRLHSVHPIALDAGAPSFRNHRFWSALATERFGNVGLIEIGALCVGTICQTYSPGPVTRGQEKGFFRFGGSTVVALLEPGRLTFDDDLVAESADGRETYVKMGTRVGRAARA
jgi:phosphatidylserine decarboxylase